MGFFLSPSEKIREKRILESTPRAKGRATILTTSDTFRLKDSNVKSLSINRGKSSGVCFDYYFSNIIHYIGVNAQNEEKIEIFSNSINTTGPVWLEYNCEQTACQGMELIVNNSGLNPYKFRSTQSRMGGDS